MPELPEVETVVRDLRPVLHGSVIGDIWVSDRPLRYPWRPEWKPLMIGRSFVSLHRRAKWIILSLDDSSRVGIHLGMTGQLQIFDRSAPIESHTHLRFYLQDGRELRFRDIRRFGGVVRWDTQASEAAPWEGELGPEPWEIDATTFCHRLKESHRAIKAWLLDQSQLAGVGNIYADEALFAARIWPGERADSLTARQAVRLHRALNDILRQAIASRGTSIRTYVGGRGLKGQFQHRLNVYGRTGQPCHCCRSRVERTKISGRSTHYCPKCQARRGAVVSEAD